MTSSDIKLLFQVVDENYDGDISYGEFSKYICSIHGDKKIDDPDHVLYDVAD
jgi:Ca2+-binding EF-hand superfamily protein